MLINPQKIDWNGQRYHQPGNVGAVVMYVFFMQALHDVFHFNWRRFERIYNTFQQNLHSLGYIRDYDPYKKMANELGVAFLYQTYKDIQKRMPKLIEDDDLYPGVLNKQLTYTKAERHAVQEAAEIVYIMLLYILKRDFQFTDAKLQSIQDKVKFYMRCVSDGDVRIVEFMECLRKECRQQFGALTEYKQKGYKVKIYG